MRDFAQTDEAFRLRSVGQRNFMTYKGPKLDAATKSRHEREAPLGDGPAALEAADEIFRQLSFEPVAAVRKQRQTFRLTRSGHEFEVALDTVEQLGKFVEIEIQVEAAIQKCALGGRGQAPLAELATELQLDKVERRSYLELVLDRSQ